MTRGEFLGAVSAVALTGKRGFAGSQAGVADTKETVPILFDTDIGNDIDDAIALSYLLKQPRCQLLGITTVSGDTAKRAALAEALCRAAKKDNIPIHAGLTGPLLHGRGQSEVAQYKAIESTPHRTNFGAPSEAVLFLRDTIRKNPGKLTLLAVGPLTNIAALFALDPEVPGLLKRVVLMCGVFTGGMASHGPGAREWNALIDPVATGIVYRHAKPGTLLSVGLDVTEQCTLPVAECRTRFAQAGGPLALVLKLGEEWFKGAPQVTFHDPLAAAMVFEPGICQTQRGTINTSTDDDKMQGMTAWAPMGDGPHTVASGVDKKRFFDHYFTVTGG